MLADIISGDHPKGIFSICDQIEWVNLDQEVRVGGLLKKLRDSSFVDSTGSSCDLGSLNPNFTQNNRNVITNA